MRYDRSNISKYIKLEVVVDIFDISNVSNVSNISQNLIYQMFRYSLRGRATKKATMNRGEQYGWVRGGGIRRR